MKIDGYAVQMNAQYFNLALESTQAEISKNTQDFSDESGMKIETLETDKLEQDAQSSELSAKLSNSILQNINSQSRSLVEDRVEITHTSIEAQDLSFSVDAVVIADGVKRNISLDLNLSRSFVQQINITQELVQKSLIDPLVISLDGSMPSLSSQTFSFDIDSDGKSDQISQLKSGNGFLALDKNSNGKIDNGSELFGTSSGDGFRDLSAYDDDKNGWIDENDKIFDKLRIWQKDSDKESLLGLGEVGIGAIFLGNTTTPFSIKSESNELLGEMRKSGFVLFENGKAGVMSHIDLAVQTKEDLNELEKIQESISVKELSNLYKKNEEMIDEGTSTDEKMKMIQEKITTLEAKLSKASEDEKAAIQVQIGALFSQMMSMLEPSTKTS